MLLNLGLAAALAALAPQPAPAAGEAHVVLSVRSFDEIFGDSSYVMGGGTKGNGPSPIEGFVNQFTGGKGLDGVDRTKPFGVYLTFTPAGMPEGVAWIPVKDPRAFCQAWRARFPDGQPGDDRLFMVQAFGLPLMGKVSRGHCFISQSPAALESPAVPRTEGSQDVNLQVNLGLVPDELKEMLIAQIKARMDARALDLPHRAGASYLQGYLAGQAYMNENIEKTIRDAQRFGIGLTVDQASGVVSVEWELVAKPGTPLAGEMTAFGSSVSSFAGLFSSDAAASFVVTGPIPPQIRESLAQEFARVDEEARARLDSSMALRTPEAREAAHDTLGSFFKAWSGLERIDVAGVIDTAPGRKLRLVIAAKAASGSDLTKAIQGFASAPDGPLGKGALKLDVASHSGARIHSLKLPPDIERDLGKGPVHLAVRGDALIVAAGTDSLAAVKAALDRTSAPGARRPPAMLHVRPSKLVDLLAPPGSAAAMRARSAFQGRGDHASFEMIPIPYGARGRLALGEGFLKLLAAEVGASLPSRAPAGPPRAPAKR
jgi:hypothetical protein